MTRVALGQSTVTDYGVSYMDAARTTLVTIPLELWGEMGEPGVIAVTIDHLTPEPTP